MIATDTCRVCGKPATCWNTQGSACDPHHLIIMPLEREEHQRRWNESEDARKIKELS